MFQIVVADNPWKFADKLTMSRVKRGADAQYNGHTLGPTDLLALAGTVSKLVNDDAAIWSWVPSSMVKLGIQFVEECGFEVSGTYNWTKLTKDGKGLAFGMGHLFRQCHEIAIEGRRGRIVSLCENKSQRSVCLAPNLKHSQKPEDLQDSLDIMFPKGNKLELFARRSREKWACYGNEIDGRDIRQSLAELLEHKRACDLRRASKSEEKEHEPQ